MAYSTIESLHQIPSTISLGKMVSLLSVEDCFFGPCNITSLAIHATSTYY